MSIYIHKKGDCAHTYISYMKVYSLQSPLYYIISRVGSVGNLSLCQICIYLYIKTHLHMYMHCAGVHTVEPPVADPPRSGRPPKSGQAPRNGLQLP